MEPHGSPDTAVDGARIVAASRDHALVRVRLSGPQPGGLALSFVTAAGEAGAGRPLPAIGGPDVRLLAFALPLRAVRERPRRLELVDDGLKSWPVPWSPPDPLLEGSRPAAAHPRVHTGMASHGMFRATRHVAVGGAAWFVYLTELLFQSTVGLPEAWEQLLGVVAASALLVGVLAAGWVAWNVSLFRRHGERRASAPGSYPSPEWDALGRRILSSVRAPREARTITVTIADGDAGAVKRFAEHA